VAGQFIETEHFGTIPGNGDAIDNVTLQRLIDFRCRHAGGLGTQLFEQLADQRGGAADAHARKVFGLVDLFRACMQMTGTVGVNKEHMGLVVFVRQCALVIQLLQHTGSLGAGFDHARQLDHLGQRKTIGGIALYRGRHIRDTPNDGVIGFSGFGQCLRREKLNFDAAIGGLIQRLAPFLQSVMDGRSGWPGVGESQCHVGSLGAE